MPLVNQALFSKPVLSNSAASSLAGRQLDFKKKEDTGLKWLRELLRIPRGLVNALEIIHAGTTVSMKRSCLCLPNIPFNLISLGN